MVKWEAIGRWLGVHWAEGKVWAWKNRFWIAAIAVSIASSPGDGGFISRFMNPFLAYTMNFVIDGVTEFFGHTFMMYRSDTQEGKARDRRKAWSWVLLVPLFGMNYFQIVFSHQEYALRRPEMPAYLLWSLAAFAPAALIGLFIAQALTDAGAKKVKKVEERPVVVPIADPLPELSTEARREALVDLLRDRPKATQGELAGEFSVSRTTIGNDLSVLEKQKVITRGNGAGVKVL